MTFVGLNEVASGELSLRGRAHGAPSAVKVVAGRIAAAGICQGGAPKRYPFVEPNEDAVLVIEGRERILLAVADAHSGASASEIAIDWLRTYRAGAWTTLPVEPLAWPAAASEAFAAIGHAIREENEKRGEASTTTLALAVVDLPRSLAFLACAGDSRIFLATQQLCEEVPPTEGAGLVFLGDDATLDWTTAVRQLEAPTWLVLATDGLCTEGVGVSRPDILILSLCASAECLAEHPQPAEWIVRRLLEEARGAQSRNDAGDSIAVAAVAIDGRTG